MFSDHGWLTSLLWVCGQAEASWWLWHVAEDAYFMAARKQRDRQEGARVHISFKDTPPVTSFLQPVPTSQ
jgi:hypothetical protein